jgi:ParB family chromosome partitioning protein
MKRKALGKGLGSLIPQAPRPPAPAPTPGSPHAAAADAKPRTGPSGEFQIDIDRIHPNPKQPRQDFNEEALAELTQSLRSQGLIQPVVVRPRGDGHFELIAGERRWRAAQRAGLHRLPAVVRDVPDARLLELALIENVQRAELNAIEEAQAYQVLLQDLGLTQESVADRVGKSRVTVTNVLRLLQLPRQVQERVRRGKLSMGQARAILGVATANAQIELAEKVENEGWSVRQVEAWVARESRDGASKAKKAAEPRKDPNVEAAEQKLQRVLGTRVRIVGRGKGGRLELHYFGPEELDRLYNLLIEAGRRRAGPSA